MRIKQLFCKFGGHFASAMAKKYNLEDRSNNINPKEPLLMFGCYDFRHLHMAINHSRFNNQFAVICWGGSDASNFRKCENPGNAFWPDLCRNAGIKHIAISHWIAEDLEALGLEYKLLPITPHDFSTIAPEPLGESIYMYQPDSKNYNGNGLYQELKTRLPYKFIETSFGLHERDELMELYKKCFIGLRFTEHDGLSNTVCELGAMGRMVVSNGDTPNCIHYDKDNIDEIIKAIDFEYRYFHDLNADKTEAVSKAVMDYLNIGDDFLNTEFYV